MVPLTHYLVLAGVVFAVGAVGVMIRRSAIVTFMCIELMLNAVNLTFIAFSKSLGNLHGQIAVFFVMVVAAAEAAIGLAIIISLFRQTQSVETSDAGELRL